MAVETATTLAAPIPSRTPPRTTVAARPHLVLIPAYNEEGAIAATVAGLQSLPAGYELVVVNDGSTDRTGEEAERAAAASRLPARVLHLPTNGGIGVAVQTGYRYARHTGRYEFVIQCDGDGQHDPAFIPTLVEECRRRNLDLCIGSRFLDRTGGDRSTRLRRMGIGMFVRLIVLLAGVRLTDPTSGFRCAGPAAWRRFAESYPEDYPEPESLHWCLRNRLAVGEVAVRMRSRAAGVSSIRSWRSAFYMLKVSLAILIDRLRAEGQ
ncbi:glycosyltransferase family 2 protein [Limnoglobus roseus]|uniref:GT2 family glycosyltransferase n=1 Tax=Limnoglobus roseus TaxID=2598579 RepID=A0A5C1AHQ8_9BACT|nr:glycosyltransferase family 2 protein [Limnoglobus roseus]QEL18370.1 GT2 family glycosyltransferase [Limnoglobus roseus]